MERPIPIDEEYIFDDGIIISETDLKGIITYSNRKFCEISGYNKSELKGKWVYTFISPIFKEKKIIGYTAARKPASRTEIEEAKMAYEKSLREENQIKE